MNKGLLDPKINVLLNTKAKASSIAKVPTKQLVLLNLQPTFQELHRLVSSNGDIASNLLITSDSERSYSVSCYKPQQIFSIKKPQRNTIVYQIQYQAMTETHKLKTQIQI